MRATSADQGQLAIYVAQCSSDSALTLLFINKNTGALTSTVTLNGFTPSSTAQVYSYSTNNLNVIVRQSDQVVTANGYTSTFPASSITLMVVPAQSNLLPKLFLPFLQR